ncbi:hypothetical protein ACROYT_G020329 [Oculina patagonica]
MSKIVHRVLVSSQEYHSCGRYRGRGSKTPNPPLWICHCNFRNLDCIEEGVASRLIHPSGSVTAILEILTGQ